MIIGILGTLIFIGLPLAIAIGLACIIYISLSDYSMIRVVTRLYNSLSMFPLLAVTFFMLTGGLMGKSGITKKLVNLAFALVGSFLGGLAQVNILVSMFFAGITGSAVADSAAVGSLLIPAMIEEGYEKDFSVAVTSTSSVIGVIIPPSIPIVITAIVSNTSVGALLLAGIIPGILVGLTMMLVTYFIARKRNYVRHKRVTFKELVLIILDAMPSLFTVVIIVGGIYTGIFTPTESSIVAVLYTLLLGGLVYRTLDLKKIYEVFIWTAITGGAAMFIFANASILSWIMSTERLPTLVMEAILSLTTSRVMVLSLITFLLLIVGTFMDTTPAIILLVPILQPIANKFGLHPIQFGMMMAMGLSIGLTTPPVGLCLFVSSSIAKISIEESLTALLPYLLALILILFMIIFIPEITLFIPKLAFPFI